MRQGGTRKRGKGMSEMKEKKRGGKGSSNGNEKRRIKEVKEDEKLWVLETEVERKDGKGRQDEQIL